MSRIRDTPTSPSNITPRLLITHLTPPHVTLSLICLNILFSTRSQTPSSVWILVSECEINVRTLPSINYVSSSRAATARAVHLVWSCSSKPSNTRPVSSLPNWHNGAITVYRLIIYIDIWLQNRALESTKWNSDYLRFLPAGQCLIESSRHVAAIRVLLTAIRLSGKLKKYGNRTLSMPQFGRSVIWVQIFRL